MLGPLTQSYSVEEFKNDIMDFRVKVLPTQLVGCSILWKIVLEAKNEVVTLMAIEMINKIHTKLADDLDDRIGEISSDFVETAIEKLRLYYQGHQSIAQNNLTRSHELVKLLKLIEGMLDNSERRGNSGITPLISVPKGYDITLKIQTYCMDALIGTVAPAQFDLAVHSRITYWQLTMLIAKILKVAPEMLRLIPMACKIGDRDTGKILEELNVPDGEQITVTKRSEEFTPRVNLVRNKVLTDKARSVFTEIYERFSKEGKFTRQGCAEFTQVCLVDKNITEEDHQITALFKEYDKQDKGYLTIEEFLGFYELASINRERVVWSNLKELGYGPDLNKLNAEKSIIITTSLPKDKLPRYLLANNSDYLEFLFSLVSIIYPIRI
jgi:hypothetical protein